MRPAWISYKFLVANVEQLDWLKDQTQNKGVGVGVEMRNIAGKHENKVQIEMGFNCYFDLPQ